MYSSQYLFYSRQMSTGRVPLLRSAQSRLYITILCGPDSYCFWQLCHSFQIWQFWQLTTIDIQIEPLNCVIMSGTFIWWLILRLYIAYWKSKISVINLYIYICYDFSFVCYVDKSLCINYYYLVHGQIRNKYS